jgi:hypothetical protein
MALPSNEEIMKRFLPILCIIVPFLLYKIFNLSIRLSDSNIYFYTGYQLLQGKVLYKDIFFTNFPLLPYISSLYFIILFGSLTLFFLTPALEASAVAILIYFLVQKQTKNPMLPALSSMLYLYSFIVLATSDHQSGVFIASLFAVISYYFFTEKKYVLTGIFIALALLTKAYFLPIIASYTAVLLLTKAYKPFAKLLTAALITTLVVLLPTLLFAYQDFIKDVFIYSLTRTQGVEKGRLIWFFLTHDFILFVALLFNFYLLTKKNFFGFVSLFGMLFFFIYQDIYYLYLNYLVPFLCISIPYLYQALEKNFKPNQYVLPSVIGIFILYNVFSYISGFRNLQKVDLSEMTKIIKKQNPKYLYGINSLTPALSYTSGIPLLHNIVDTNPNIYRKGFLSSKKMSDDAIKSNTLIIGEGMDYPIYQTQELLIGEIFIVDTIKKSCKNVASFPVQNEGIENRINLFSC